MCGRFALIASPEEMRALYGYIDEEWFPPRYNIAPTQPVATVLRHREVRQLRLMRWGLVPSFVKDPAEFALLINARREGIAERASYRGAIRYRRCIIPASGFYEWQVLGRGRKQPFWLAPAGGGLIAFAGLYETWMGADGSEIDTACIITGPATKSFASIHNRMPIIVADADIERWLSPAPPDEIEDILVPPPEGLLRAIPVSDRVNSADNDGPELLEEVDPDAEPDLGPLFRRA